MKKDHAKKEEELQQKEQQVRDKILECSRSQQCQVRVADQPTRRSGRNGIKPISRKLRIWSIAFKRS
jgi:flagellar basal body-associated protein FliL